MTGTQDDIVARDTPITENSSVRRIKPHGIENLHKRGSDEVAAALTNIIKSTADVVEIRYVLGEYFDLTIRK